MKQDKLIRFSYICYIHIFDFPRRNGDAKEVRVALKKNSLAILFENYLDVRN